MFYFEHMTVVEHAVSGTVPEFDINDRLRKAREVTGLSQAEMAREIGVARTSVVTYETGHKQPTRPVVRAWAFRTGVPYEWICHGDELPCGQPPGSRLRTSEGDGVPLGRSSNIMQSSQTKIA
jgi:DNA-binding XRE family transcriptional regulator